MIASTCITIQYFRTLVLCPAVTVSANISRPRMLVGFAVLALVLIASFLLFREPATPHVTAAFISFPDSLRPRLAAFTITNHSSRMVHFTAHQFPIHSKPFAQQSKTIPPGESIVLELTVPEPLEAHTHIELLFRRQDTPVEEAREMLDSVLRSLGIKVAGLNPDSSGNHFQITSTIPSSALKRSGSSRGVVEE